MKISALGLVVAVSCSLVLGACGGDDDDATLDARPGGPDGRTFDGEPGAADAGPGGVDGAADAGPGAADGAPGAADAVPGGPDAPVLPPADGPPTLPDAAIVVLVDAPPGGTPRDVDGRITINELMAGNATTVLDDTGVAADWIELHNPTDVDLPLEGYALSDSVAIPRRAVLAAGVVVPAHGYLVLWLDHLPAKGARHLAFQLRREGGDVVLERPDGSPIDRLTYGAQEIDFSAAREPDDSDHWVIEWHPTPGAANPTGPGAAMGLENPSLPPEVVPAAGDLSARILGYDVMPSIEIVVSAANAAALEASPSEDVPGMLVFDGRSYGPVGVRLKGQNSFQPFSQKPSFRINIDEYVERAKFFGLKDLTLNNMDNDPSMMHERLAYLVARQAGVPASRSNHALVTVNGAFYGLYANVETVKRGMIARWFTNADGPLFEGTDVDFVPGSVDDFEHEAGPDDRSLLTGLAAALTTASPDAAIAAASAFIDIAAFQRFWAMEAVIGQFDALPYSTPGDDYLVYADPTASRLRLIPWGMDETMQSSSHPVLDVSSVLANKCLDSSTCFQGFVDQTFEILAITEAMDLAGERARVAAAIAPHVALDTRKPYSAADVSGAQANQGYFIRDRRTHLTEQLPPPSP